MVKLTTTEIDLIIILCEDKVNYGVDCEYAEKILRLRHKLIGEKKFLIKKNSVNE